MTTPRCTALLCHGEGPFVTTRNTSIDCESTQRYFHTSLTRAATTTTSSTTTSTNTTDDAKPPEIIDSKESTDAVPKEKESVQQETLSDKGESDVNAAASDVPPEVVVEPATTNETKEESQNQTKETETKTSTDETKPTPVAAPDKKSAKEGKHRDKKQPNTDAANDAAAATATKKPSSSGASGAVATDATTTGIRQVDVPAIAPSLEGGPPIVDGVRQYSTPEITKDAKFHKSGLSDPTRPEYQNPLHHNNPDYDDRFFKEDFATEEEFNAAILPAPPLDNPDGSPTYPKYLHDLADDMVHLTMLEMNELLNRMADHYGFHEGILSPEGVGDDNDDGTADDDGGDGGGAKAEAEKTAFDVKLVSYDATVKIKIIKEVRVVIPGLGLKEAKELVEGAPVTLQKGVSKEVAEQAKEKLVALGAVIEIV